MATVSVVNLVKEMLPDAIKRTERDTFVFNLDGEQCVYPSYRSAATAIGATLGVGKRHLPIEEVQRRLGPVQVLYSAPKFSPRDMRTPPPVKHDERDAPRAHTPVVAAPAPTPAAAPVAARTRAPRQPRQPGAVRQQRSVRVLLPQSAVAELLRTGKVRILLAVK